MNHRRITQVEIVGVVPNNAPCVFCHEPFTFIHWLTGQVMKTDNYESIHKLCLIKQHATKSKLIRGADLFCGAGGTSTGLLRAARTLGFNTELLAINHWDIAIATHQLNHERVKHLCQNLDKVDPLELIPGGRLDILVASPECTHHSNARGGKPRSDQKRADAWLLMRWLEKLYVKIF
jgi:hypothetical protein